MNPADLPTRGVSGKQLVDNELWWQGPVSLKDDILLTSTSEKSLEIEIDEVKRIVEKELARSAPEVTHSLLNKVKSASNFIDFDRFSTKLKLVRATAFVLRFVHNLKCLTRKKDIPREDELETQELIAAEQAIIRVLQAEYFTQELCYLSGLHVNNVPAYVKQFNLFMDEYGLLRCKSRLQNADTNALENTPILVSTHCRCAELIVRDSHEKVFHNGIDQTLCHIRMKYWIPRLRELVKKNVRRCVICKRLEGKFYEPPPPPPLPDFRVSDNPPFTNVGLDFIGPLLTRTADKDEIQKSYICLFTCTSSRGLHREACESLNISSFRLLFRRYCSRRGLPVLLISDNASTFKSAENEIRKC